MTSKQIGMKLYVLNKKLIYIILKFNIQPI